MDENKIIDEVNEKVKDLPLSEEQKNLTSAAALQETDPRIWNKLERWFGVFKFYDGSKKES